MSIKDNIKKFYTFNFVASLMFAMPIIVLFWQENGLSLTQIMFLQSIFAFAIALFEVPTGVFADKLGRKYSIMMVGLTLSIGSTVYALGHTFWQFAIAEIIYALGVTFMSGADSAFIYDTLKQTKKEHDYKRIWGNSDSLGYLAAGLSAIVGGFVGKYDLRLTWILEAIAMFIAVFIALTFKEPKHFKKVEQKNHWKHTTECFKESFTNKSLLFLFLFYSIAGVLARISLWFYQPYMKESGIDVAYFGIVWASFTIFAIFGSKFAHKIENYLGQKMSLWVIIIMTTLSSFLMGKFFFIFGVIFIFMQQIIRGFIQPVLGDYTNKLISSEKRATLLSIQSLGGNLGFAILGPIYGWIADASSLGTSLMFTGISFFIAFALLMYWGRNLRSVHKI